MAVDPRTLLVLRTAATRDGVSLSELLRPVVERYARRRLRDPNLATAVTSLEASHREEQERRNARRGGAPVTSLRGRNTRETPNNRPSFQDKSYGDGPNG